MTKKRLTITSALLAATLALSMGTVGCSAQKTAEETRVVSAESVANKSTDTILNVDASFGKEQVTKVVEAANTIKDEKVEEQKAEEKKAEEQKKEEQKTEVKKATVSTNTNNNTVTAQPSNEDRVAAAQAAVDAAPGGASRVIALTNLRRAEAGLGGLRLDGTLSAMAAVRAQEIVSTWSHTRPDGSNVTALASQYGLSYSVIGENLAYGQTSADQAVAEWMASPGHRANIMGNYSRIGIGIFQTNGRTYWVQLFAR